MMKIVLVDPDDPVIVSFCPMSVVVNAPRWSRRADVLMRSE